MSGHPFWFMLVCLAVAWYALLTVYVGWKGYHEIHVLVSALRDQLGKSPPSHSAGGES